MRSIVLLLLLLSPIPCICCLAHNLFCCHHPLWPFICFSKLLYSLTENCNVDKVATLKWLLVKIEVDTTVLGKSLLKNASWGVLKMGLLKLWTEVFLYCSSKSTFLNGWFRRLSNEMVSDWVTCVSRLAAPDTLIWLRHSVVCHQQLRDAGQKHF